jgi:3-hydroxyisobutyrate dehydrogenase
MHTNDIKNKSLTLGWIGTGVMGKSMVSHLLRNKYKCMIYNRTREKALPLLENNAVWGKNPKEVAKNADIIFTMVGYPIDVEECYFGTNSIFEADLQGKVLVDMTTTSPHLAKKISKHARKKKAFSLDAPVSGGDIGAKQGTLSIMVGGEKKTFSAILPLFKIMGENIVYQGKAGAGQHTKMANQIALATCMIGVCECLYYGMKADLDLEIMLQSISKGAAGSWSLTNLAPRIVRKDFEPGFYLEHFIKDMSIALEETKRMEIHLPGLVLAQELYKKLQEKGYGKKGTQALMHVYTYSF